MSSKNAILRWLLDSDPAIRWQVLRDLVHAPEADVAAERARIATEGWGAQLLDRQRPDGRWGDGGWAANLFSLLLLKNLGIDPADARVRAAVARVREQVTWGPEFGNFPFFEGEVEPCINGNTLAIGCYFGEISEPLLARLLGEQLADGGWNCEAERGSVRSSFHSTICVLEGLLEYEKARGATPAVTKARSRAHDYLLDRHLFRRLSNGEVIDSTWTRFAFPTLWRYDVLRGLDYLRDAGVAYDKRMDDALALVEKRRHQNGRWPFAKPHEDPAGFPMEAGRGKASRWITLRAMRVLELLSIDLPKT